MGNTFGYGHIGSNEKEFLPLKLVGYVQFCQTGQNL